MFLSFLNFDSVSNLIILNDIDQLFNDLILKLLTREVTAVGHDHNGLLQNRGEEADVESCTNFWDRTEFIIDVPETLQTNFHDLGLLMLQGKNDSVYNGLEHLTLKLKDALGTMVDNIVYQFEKRLSKVRVVKKVVHNNLESRLAKSNKDVFNILVHVGTLFFENRSEKKEDFRVTRIWDCLLIIGNHHLKRWQKGLIEIRKIDLLLNIDLNKFKNLSSNRFHGLDEILVHALCDTIANAF